MKILPHHIFPDVLIIEPESFHDLRGCLFESYRVDTLSDAIGYQVDFVQENYSFSKKGVLRGMHYQLPPYEQGKLIRAISGEIYDVFLDIRASSPTFGKWSFEILDSSSQRQIWIPSGFAHGFLALSEHVEILYKVTKYYSPPHERSIVWNDNDVSIKWPEVGKLSLSDKDKSAVHFREADLFV